MVHPPPFSLVATFVRPVSFGVFIRRVSRAHLEARANATLAAICHLRVLSFPRWEILIYRIIWPEAKYMCIWLYLKRVLGYRPRMYLKCICVFGQRPNTYVFGCICRPSTVFRISNFPSRFHFHA